MTDHLRGKVVLVHPDLPYDPMQQQNEIGAINYITLILDEVFVDFNGYHGIYTMDALLVFIAIDDIHQHLADIAYETPFVELKALTQIDLILRYGGENKEWKAMEIAKRNPAIHRFCLESLNDQLYRDISNQYGRE